MLKTKKKITLNSQTVRNLRPDALEGILGGIPVTSGVNTLCGGCRACG